MFGPKVFDRVKDTTTTTGTGTLTLANSAPTGFRTFGSVLSNSDTCFYVISSSGGAEWEVGIGTYTTSGTTLARTTVLASSNSDAAVNLSAGTKDVFLSLPADFENYFGNITNTFANLVAYKAGRLLFPSNGFNFYRDTGSLLVPYGPLFQFTEPISGDFAWINQGGASVATTNGGIYLSIPLASGDDLRLRKKAAPSTPYTITAAFLINNLAAPSVAGLCFRESSSGKIHGFYVQPGRSNSAAYLASDKWTDPNNFSASYASYQGLNQIGSPTWLRVSDNGTNRICSFSADGQNWMDFHSVTRTDFLTANEVGFFANANNTVYGLGMTLLSWKEG